MSGRPLSERLAAFRQNFKAVLGNRGGGYSQLNAPLVSEGSAHSNASFGDYEREHGVSRPGIGSGQQRVGGVDSTAGFQATSDQGLPPASAHVPSQAEEILQLSGLAKEAAELLWEMLAMGDFGETAEEMHQKGQQLQAQLRGMIGDYSDPSETAMATALEAFETLSNTMEEYEKTKAPSQPAATTTYPTLATSQPASTNLYTDNPFQATRAPVLPPPAAPRARQQDDEAPLISFD